ncbi:MAG: HEAT repeat domain-containing protein, partial [Planctomycetota bacterium]
MLRTTLLALTALVLPAAASVGPLAPSPATSPPATSAPAPRTALQEADEEAVKEFKRFFKKLDTPEERVEAVLTLEGNESPAVVDALARHLDHDEADVVRAAIRVLAGFKTRPPVERLVAVFGKTKAEASRVALLSILREGGWDGLGEVVEEALLDRSWAVRRQAVFALGAGAVTGTPLAAKLAALVADPEVAVRCAALDALADAKAREVVPVAQAQLVADKWQVRASAIRALSLVRDKTSIPLLIERLATEEGRLVEDVGRALNAITGRNIGARAELWERFWNTVANRKGRTYEIPTDEELAKRAAAAKETAKRYSSEDAVSFGGIETPSRAILFVIDVSGSMEDLIVDRDNFDPDLYPSWSRMDIVKTELATTIDGLEPYVRFGIIAFATETRQWKRTLVPANIVNKKSALSFVSKLEPIGGNSKQDLVDVGLAQPEDLSMGKTNTYGALALAFGVDQGKKRAKPSKEKYLGEVDTIFFLSDGKPTHGDYIAEKEILARIKEANGLRKIVLHTIAIGNFSKGFMEGLAIQ